jgi:hypothetical protein
LNGSKNDWKRYTLTSSRFSTGAKGGWGISINEFFYNGYFRGEVSLTIETWQSDKQARAALLGGPLQKSYMKEYTDIFFQTIKDNNTMSNLNYLPGETVTVVDDKGELAGEARVNLYDVATHRYSVNFLYKQTGEFEKIKLPGYHLRKKKQPLLNQGYASSDN